MLPKIIVHNSISMDCSLTNFDVNMAIHYKLAGNYHPDAHLIGSNTAKTGIESYGHEDLPEETTDLKKPKRDNKLPYWVIIDTNGHLNGLLHNLRRFKLCKDIIILISEKTSKDYIKYLEERNYCYHVVGKNHADIRKALELLAEKYRIKTILADTGMMLSGILLNLGFVYELSLLIHPIITGGAPPRLFSNIGKKIGLKLVKTEVLDKEYIWLVYRVENILH